jgi:hypothetical protein
MTKLLEKQLEYLMTELRECEETEEDDYTEIVVVECQQETLKAILLVLSNDYYQPRTLPTSKAKWFPKSCLRTLDGILFCKRSFLEQEHFKI